jgi:hypothetical protein
LPNRLGLAAAFLLTAVLAGCTHPAPRAAAPSPPARAHAATAGPLTAGPATFPGPDGVRARWVIQENDRPGTTAWEIHGSHAGIAGFASQVYARQGQQVTLYVSTTGPWFRAQAFRVGWYRGKGARLIWASARVAGSRQPACPVTSGVNMVACDNCPSRPYSALRDRTSYARTSVKLLQ